MRLLIKVDYDTYFLFPSTSPMVIEAFAGAQCLKSEGYGESQIYVPKTADIEVKLVSEADLRLPENAESPFVARLKTLEQELAAVRVKSYNDAAEAAKVKKAYDALKAQVEGLS